MRGKILALGLVLALVAVMVMPMAVLAADTTTVDATVGSASVTINAPTTAGLGSIDYHAGAYQYVTHATAGSVDVTNIRGSNYAIKVKGNVTKLTCASPSGTLANDLQIATGPAGSTTVGIVNTAGSLTTGTYGDPTTAVVPVTTSDSVAIVTGQTTSVALNLTVFQHMNAGENPAAGTYTLTLTYTATISY